MPILEATIERKCAALALQQGAVLIKLLKRTGWPDRECILPNGRHFYVEFKRPGGELSPVQRHIQSQLVAMGHQYFEVDNAHMFKRILAERLALPPP